MPKNVTADELASAIRAAYVGRPTLAPEAAQALIHASIVSHAPPKIGFDLTKPLQTHGKDFTRALFPVIDLSRFVK